MCTRQLWNKHLGILNFYLKLPLEEIYVINIHIWFAANVLLKLNYEFLFPVVPCSIISSCFCLFSFYYNFFFCFRNILSPCESQLWVWPAVFKANTLVLWKQFIVSHYFFFSPFWEDVSYYWVMLGTHNLPQLCS